MGAGFPRTRAVGDLRWVFRQVSRVGCALAVGAQGGAGFPPGGFCCRCGTRSGCGRERGTPGMLFAGCWLAVYRGHQSSGERSGLVTAHPVDDHDPDDPVGILSVLPEEYHAQFLIEYAAAVEGARRPEQFRQLQELLRLWRLRAVAYSSPGYDERLAAVRRGRAADFAPAEHVIPGWSGRGPAA
jgi:Family of unknown function (DUF6247)